MSTIPLVIGKTMKYGEWLFDSDLEERDNAALIAYDRREAIERAVTFDELLEECATQFTGPQMEAFMGALARGGNADLHLMYCLLDQMKEQIVKRRLAGGV
jgi:uncharacterized protein CbrC (UPF0167 family)